MAGIEPFLDDMLRTTASKPVLIPLAAFFAFLWLIYYLLTDTPMWLRYTVLILYVVGSIVCAIIWFGRNGTGS
jgi:hypothetical protein